jgi:hypothetical protein
MICLSQFTGRQTTGQLEKVQTKGATLVGLTPDYSYWITWSDLNEFFNSCYSRVASGYYLFYGSRIDFYRFSQGTFIQA